MINKKITTGNILNGLFTVMIIVILINPAAKGLLIRGLMNIGFFQPNVPVSASKKTLAEPFNITFRNAKGQAINTADLKGKVIFINFWATWCPPCIAEMPSVNQLYAKFKNNNDVIFIIVDVDNDYTKALAFMQKHNLNLPMHTLASSIPDNIMDGTIPTTLVFNKRGEMVYRHIGAANYSNNQFMAFLNSLNK
ncbi:MAG: TlpA disulfide reductase family protein [Mucilaginibacter sp.]|uniref:TlpA family protein disulfide reductase n=1 Tax=Mucilaginibacter sp. TaxID=1882438 RepID=UPI0031AB4B7F